MKIQAVNQNMYSSNNQLSTKPNNKLNTNNNISFTAKKMPGWYERCLEVIAKTYGNAMLNSKLVRKFTAWLSDIDKTNASKHFQVLGALVTSTGYAVNTMKKDDFEKKDARTLAINQGLGFVVPTALGYFIDNKIASKTKKAEYNYIAKRERELALGKFTPKEVADAKKTLSRGIVGFRALMAIITFTTLYRFVVPVAITPLANKIGHYVEEKRQQKAQQKMAQQGLDKVGVKETIESTKEELNKVM